MELRNTEAQKAFCQRRRRATRRCHVQDRIRDQRMTIAAGSSQIHKNIVGERTFGLLKDAAPMAACTIC